MNFKITLIFLTLFIFSATLAKNKKEIQVKGLPDKPNIVFIMMDDFDIFDMTKYKELFDQKYNKENEINTPNLDAFFDNALKFTNYHTNGANCSPTRGSLLTGLYPSDLGFYRAVSKNSERGIPGNNKLISELLITNGYTTATVGKWNVGHKGDSLYNPNLFKAYERGFDYSFCTVGCYIDSRLVQKNTEQLKKHQTWVGYGGSYSRFQLEHKNKSLSELRFTSIGDPKGSITDLDESQYITKVNTDKALAFIKKQNDKNARPYFLNLWYWLPHGPVHVPLGIMENELLKPEYESYYLRSNYPVPMNSGSVNEKHKIDKINCRENVGNKLVPHNLSCNSRLGEYAAMVTRLDSAIGRVLDVVKNQPNTLIIITSDNGGADSEHVLRDRSKLNSSDDISKNLGVNSSLVFKGSKNELYERGIRVPLMIRWIGDQKQDILSNETVDELVLSREFYPTLTYLAGLMLSDSHAYGNNFYKLLQESKYGKQYFNNQRSEWLTSRNKPVFYENNAGNQPRLVAIENQNQPECQAARPDQEEINYAIQNNGWKYIYSTSQWENASFSRCLPEKSELFKTEADEKGMYEKHNIIDAYKYVAKYLKLLRLRWQHTIGKVDISNQIKVNINETTGRRLKIIPNLGQLNISDGHFTFATTISPSVCDANENIVIAEKSGSWKLFFNKKQLFLQVNIAEAGDPNSKSSVMELNSASDRLACHVSNHIGFTLLGGRTSGPLIKLFINGEMVDSLVTTDFKNKIASNQIESKSLPRFHTIKFKSPYVVINNSNLVVGNISNPKLIESIDEPTIYVNPLSNGEMRLLAQNKMFENQFKRSNKIKKINLNSKIQYSNTQFDFTESETNDSLVKLTSENSTFGNSSQFGFSANIESLKYTGNKPMVIAQQNNTNSFWSLSFSKKQSETQQLKLVIQPELAVTANSKNEICETFELSGSFNQNNLQDVNQIGFVIRNNFVSLFINDVPVSNIQMPDNCEFIYGNQIFLGNNLISFLKNKFQKFNGIIKNIQLLPQKAYSIKSSDVKETGEIISFKENNKGVLLELKKQNNQKKEISNKSFVFATTMNILNSQEQTIHIANQFDIEGSGWQLIASKNLSAEPNLYEFKLLVTNKQTKCFQKIIYERIKIASFEEHQVGISFDQAQLSLFLDGEKIQTTELKSNCIIQSFDSDIILGSSNQENQFNGYMFIPRIWQGLKSESMIKWAAIYLDTFGFN